MKKIVLLAMVLLMGFVVAAQAAPVTVGDPLWYEFEFGLAPTFAFEGSGTTPSSGGNSQPAPDAPWTFNYATGVRVIVTDAFAEGDIFTLYDNNFAIGSTTFVANTGLASGTSDPAVALGIPELSHGFFGLPAGAHSLTIQVVQNALNTLGGAGFFRVDPCPPVPVPPTMLLLGSGILGLVGLRLRRKNQA